MASAHDQWMNALKAVDSLAEDAPELHAKLRAKMSEANELFTEHADTKDFKTLQRGLQIARDCALRVREEMEVIQTRMAGNGN